MARFPLLSTLVVLLSSITPHPALAVSTDQLDIKLNTDMAQNAKMAFGTQLQIAGLSSWQDSEIVHLAMVAHEKMLAVHRLSVPTLRNIYNIPKKAATVPPGVTTTLVVDNTAYISTSIKGGNFFYLAPAPTEPNRYRDLNPDKPCAGLVHTALVNCRTTEGWGHRTGASCGEPWAAQAFCSTQSARSLRDARIVTINTSRKNDATRDLPQIAHPCGDPSDEQKYAGEWGCTQFTASLGLYVIPETTAAVVRDVADGDVVNSALAYRREPTGTQGNEEAVPSSAPGNSGEATETQANEEAVPSIAF